MTGLIVQLIICRCYEYIFGDHMLMGFVPNICSIFKKEQLIVHLCIYLRDGSFPVKAEWKDIITECRIVMENHKSTMKSEDSLKYTHVR